MTIQIRAHHIAFIGLLMSCSGPDTRPAITPSPSAEVNPTPRTTIDREALYARPSGELQPKIEPMLNGFVEAVQKTSDAYYLHISHKDGWQAHVDFLVDIPGVHAQAVSRMGIVMRVPIEQAGAIPNEFDIQANFQSHGEPFMWRGRGSLQTVRVKVPENPEVSDEIETLFMKGAAVWFDYGGVWKMAPTFDFMEYASQRFEAQADPDARAYWAPTKIGLRRSKKPRRITSPDIASGGPFGGGRVPTFVSAMASGFIDLHDIDSRRFDASKVAAHPEQTRDWKAMLGKLDGKASVEPLAKHVPSHFFYAGFLPEVAGQLLPFLQGWGSLVAAAPSVPATTADTIGLGALLNVPSILELGKHFALVTSDLDFMRGSDLTLMVMVDDKPAMQNAMSVVADRLPAGAATDWVDNVLLISNSPAALREIKQTTQTTSLASQPDFRYARTVSPWSSDRPETFIFISDDAIAASRSPRRWIARLRRDEGLARVAATNFASVMYAWLEGKRAPDVDVLIKRGLVREDYVRAKPGLSYTPKHGASSEWGSLDNPRALIDHLPELVSEEEIRAYEIATPGDRILPHFVRLEPTDSGLVARIELSNTSVFWNLSSPTKTLSNPGGRFQVWNGSEYGGPGFTPLSAELTPEIDTFAAPDGPPGIFGGLYFTGELDTSYVWDLAMARGELSVLLDAERLKNIEEDREKIGGSGEYHGVAVIDDAKLKARLPDLVLDPERDCGKSVHDGVEIGCLNAWIYDGSPRVYHALAGGYWFNAGSLEVMKVLVEKAKAGEFEPIVGDGTNALSMVFPGESWHRKTLLAALEKDLHTMTLTDLRMATITQRAFGEAALENDRLRATSLTFFGRSSSQLAGGKFDLVDGRPSHSVYGNGVVGRIPEAPADGSSVRSLLNTTRSASASFGTRHGADDTHAMHQIVLRWDGEHERATSKP